MSKQIRSVVFDMGNVLLDFSIDRVIDPYFSREEDRALVRQVVFDSGEWDRLDAGDFTEEEALARWQGMVPEPLREGVAGMFAHWHETLVEIEGMAALIRDLKARGYRCYLLSNTSLRVETYWQDFEALRLLEERFISARVRLMKPDPAIYEAMCRTFGIAAEESVFIDDRPENVRGAEQVGMRGIWFPAYDVEALRKNLEAEGVLV